MPFSHDFQERTRSPLAGVVQLAAERAGIAFVAATGVVGETASVTFAELVAVADLEMEQVVNWH